LRLRRGRLRPNQAANAAAEAGVHHDLKVYPGTKHAFFNDTLRSYDAGAVADSWQRVLAFFEEHVEGTAPTPSSEP
jgi:carboxymethylenebutenolidase